MRALRSLVRRHVFLDSRVVAAAECVAAREVVVEVVTDVANEFRKGHLGSRVRFSRVEDEL